MLSGQSAHSQMSCLTLEGILVLYCFSLPLLLSCHISIQHIVQYTRKRDKISPCSEVNCNSLSLKVWET